MIDANYLKPSKAHWLLTDRGYDAVLFRAAPILSVSHRTLEQSTSKDIGAVYRKIRAQVRYFPSNV